MSRRRDLPGMNTSGPNWKEDLSKRLYNLDGSRNDKGEEDRHLDKNKLRKTKKQKVTDILNKIGALKQ